PGGSPLSLHDALPILERVPGGAAFVRVLVRRRLPPARALELRARRGRRLVQADAAAMNLQLRVRPPRKADLPAWAGMRAALWPEDRKSTRLNSSHVKI